MISLREAVCNVQNGTPVPKSMMKQGKGYKPGQRFDGDRFAQLCVDKGLDPAEAALELLKSERGLELKAKELLDAYTKLMEYVYPKQRAVEHSGSLDVGLSELLHELEERERGD